MMFVLAALALSGCCASSTGCYVPVPGVPTAWDGDGPSPDGEAPLRKKPVRRAKLATEISGAQRSEVGVTSEVAAEDAAARDEARLKRKLMICRGCLPPATGETTGSIAAR